MRTSTIVLSLLAVRALAGEPAPPTLEQHREFVEKVLLVQDAARQTPFPDVVRQAARLRKWPDGEVDKRVSNWLGSVGILRRMCEKWQGASCAGEVRVDLAKAPLRPLAFINRYDQIAVNSGCGRGSVAGAEVRFEYAFEADVLAIVEFAMACRPRKRVVEEMQRWTAGTYSPSEFLSTLQPADVSDIRLRILVAPGGPGPWLAGEFHFFPDALQRTTLAREMDPQFDAAWPSEFVTWARENREQILKEEYDLPSSMQFPLKNDGRVRGPGTMVLSNPSGSPEAEQVRVVLSRNTCRGCHGGETGTNFLHINPKKGAPKPILSGFLTGSGSGEVTLNDWAVSPKPAKPGPNFGPYSYNDLRRRHLWWKAYLEDPNRRMPAHLIRFDHAPVRR